jgi:UDP-N-acetylmuramoyl-L-alanyl-D-glutamate--2,6-diaminopimelate ligase
MRYARYHGLGNDYLVIDARDREQALTPQRIVTICHRNFGVGSDGIVLIEGKKPDGFVVRIFNPDGSEAETSGNGMRIAARYLFDKGQVSTEPFTLLAGGERLIQAHVRDPQRAIQVDMGRASFVSSDIPMIGPRREVLQESLEVLGESVSFTCVNVGNPHCVVFDYPNIKHGAQRLGRELETHEYFPRRTNVQFAQVIDRNNIRIEIWERGAGYTLASGSSACAAASAARRLGRVDSQVAVHMPGGSLAIHIGDDYSLRLIGPVTRIAEGEIDPEVFSRDTQHDSLRAGQGTLGLSELLSTDVVLDRAALKGMSGLEITSISADSRAVTPGCLFFAIQGAKVDSRELVNEVFAKGAAAVAYEGTLPVKPVGPAVQVSDVRRALSYAAHAFFGKPSLVTTNIAVTGTSGKTSVSWILSHALHFLDVRTFLGGTLGFKLLEEGDAPAAGLKELGNTTIDPISVQRLLLEAVRNGAQMSVFEATSQGMVQRRMRDVAWDVAIFTNLTRDHLDLHGTMEAYEAAKSELFLNELASSPKSLRTAIINYDDPAGARIGEAVRRSQSAIKVLSISCEAREGIDFVIEDLKATANGLSFRLQGRTTSFEVVSPFVGRHNAYNLACAAVALHALGYESEDITSVIAKVPVVPGRLEPVGDPRIPIYVDYAHKPDALEKVLAFLKPLCSGRLINVFGCGGNRDFGKRPVMGEISYRIADLTIVTSDNPRHEDPEAIIKEIVSGVPNADSARLLVESDRTKAIQAAVALAKPGDLIVIAGKGHEPYQEIKGVKYPFHDLHIAREALQGLSGQQG